MRKVFVTTSWDDGHALDRKLSDLLVKYDLTGTFYITKESKDRIADKGIIEISRSHEIGAHTLTHPNLLTILEDEAKKEINESKEWLESLVGGRVEMFCYPFGFFNSNIAKVVARAGFMGARTTEKFLYRLPQDFLSIGTTIQVYPFPFRKKTSRIFFWRYLFEPILQNYPSMRKSFRVPIYSLRSWSGLARSVFDEVLRNGDYFHLWGHSWEIEKYGMWNDLENFLRYISNRKNCIYLTNGDLLNRIKNYEDIISSR